MKSLKLIALAAGIALCATSCNTFIGIGRDMRLAGEGMEKTANKASGNDSAGEDVSGAPVY